MGSKKKSKLQNADPSTVMAPPNQNKNPTKSINNIVSSPLKNRKNTDPTEQSSMKNKSLNATSNIASSSLKRKIVDIEQLSTKKSKILSPKKLVQSEFRFKAKKTFPSCSPDIFASQSQQQNPTSSIASQQAKPIDHNSDYSSCTDDEYAQPTVNGVKFMEEEEASSDDSDDSDIEGTEAVSTKERADGSGWTKAQTDEFVYALKELPEVKMDDSWTFRHRVKGLMFGNLPGKLLPPRTEEECQERLNDILGATKKIRNLYEMLSQFNYKPAKFHGRTPINAFMAEKKEQITAAGGNFLVTGHTMFNEMDPDERERKYIKPYMDRKVKIEKLTRPLKSVLHIFGEDNPDILKEERRRAYMYLSAERKIVFIKKAYEIFCVQLRDHEQHMNDPQEPTMKPPHDKINRDDYKILLNSLGMPAMKHLSALQYYLTDVNPKECLTMTNNIDRFRHFKKSKHYKPYHNNFNDIVEEYKMEFNDWLQTLPDHVLREKAEIIFKETLCNKAGTKKASNPPKEKRRKVVKIPRSRQIAMKIKEVEASYVDPMMTAIFKGEPKPIPITVKECFKKFAVTQNSHNVIKFSMLPDNNKIFFIKAAAKNVLRYKDNIKQFADILSEEQRRMYIGQNRIKFMKLFEADDIFAEDYPVSDYPPYRPAAKALNSDVEDDVTMEFDSLLADLTSTHREENNQKGDERAFGRPQSTSTPAAFTLAQQKQQMKESKKVKNAASKNKSAASETSATQYVNLGTKTHTRKLIEEEEEEEEEEGSSSSEEEDESSSSEDEAMPAPPPTQNKSVNKSTKSYPAAAVTSSSDESDDDESSSGEEEDELVVTKMEPTTDASDSDEEELSQAWG